MWSYLLRRILLMIPTLFGVTVVSFLIMKLAPGDPLQSRLGASGTAGQSGQNREQYLLQRRELKLDKPIILNLRNYYSYEAETLAIARWRGASDQDLADELRKIGEDSRSPKFKTEVALIREFRSKRLNEDLLAGKARVAQLNDEVMLRLASMVRGYAQLWSERIGHNGVTSTLKILNDDQSAQSLRIGAVRALASMVPNPFAYTFPRSSDAEEDARVVATWKLLWERSKSKYAAVDPERAKALQAKLSEIIKLPRGEMLKELIKPQFSAEDLPFFAGVVLGENPREEKVPAAEFLRLFITERVQTELAASPTDKQLDAVSENWKSHYEANRTNYEYTTGERVYALFADTQYAHMVWRLVTFQFGNSTKKSREPVWELIWKGFVVSAPLMFMSQALIYLVAVPLGVLAGVKRGKILDRIISTTLFMLYSIPPYVAGMLLLLFLCYGSYLKIFPMERLHSQGWENFSTVRYVADYLWHAALPVTCLSLFSLAGLAMYGRSAMLDVLNQDYMRTAVAKGLPPRTTIFKHGLRNALIPIITLFANFLPALLGGSVLIEYVFGINGLGLMGFRALLDLDIPTLMALLYIDAIVVMFSMLLSDLLYVLVDPRISFESRGAS